MKNSPLQNYILGDEHGIPLPKTRAKSFSFYGKLHFWKLLFLGVVTSLFFGPSIVWLYSANYTKSQQLGALNIASVDFQTQKNTIILQHAFSDYLVLIPLIVLFFVGLSGLFGIVKRMSFCQSSGYGEYFKAIKTNGLQSALCGLAFGVSLFFVAFNVSYYTASKLSPIAKGLLMGVSVLQFVIVTIATIYLMCGLAVYTNTAKMHIVNAIKLTFGEFWKNLLIVGLCALPIVATVLIPSPWQINLLLLLPLFYVGFATLLLTCYCNAIFDKYINPMLGKESVGIGLQREEK